MSQEDVARRVVDVFYEHFRAAPQQDPDFALVRLYRTMNAARLPEELREDVLGEHVPADTKCLTMLATRGSEPEYSRVIAEWMEPPESGQTLWGWIAEHHEQAAASLREQWELFAKSHKEEGGAELGARDSSVEGAWSQLIVGEHVLDIEVVSLVHEGAWEGALIVLTDISTQQQIEQARKARQIAEEANRAKSAFLANISHELRTPLNAIIGYAEMLEEEAEYEPAISANFQQDAVNIRKAGRQLLRLISDVLDLSKIEVGRMECIDEEVELAELLTELTHTVEPLIAKRHNTLHIVPAETLEVLCTDYAKLYQSLLNLLSNAAKFTGRGDIWLRVRHDTSEDVVHFEVEDTGVGIAEQAQETIFDAFEQAEASTSRTHGGTGLGLALVHEFAQIMGGHVALESALGEGSLFRITLPARTP